LRPGLHPLQRRSLLEPDVILVGATDPSAEGLGEGEKGEYREIRPLSNVTLAFSSGMFG